MTLLTRAEIRQFLEGLWDIDMGGLHVSASRAVSVALPDLTAKQAKAHLASFLATIDRQIDADSIKVAEDAFDDSDLPVATITFEVQDETARNA